MMTPLQAQSLIEALEAFIDAKVAYELTYARDPEWISTRDLNEARDQLLNRLCRAVSPTEVACVACGEVRGNCEACS